MKRFCVLWAGVAVLGLVAGCGGPAEDDASGAPSTPAGASSSAPASSTPTGPLGTAAYQAELTKLEQGLAKDLRSLTRVRTAEALAQTMTSLAESLNTAASRLADSTVTSRLTAVHELLQDSLGTAAVSLADSDQAELNARCGGVAYTSQKVQRTLRADLKTAIAALTKLKLKFGATLPDPGPAPDNERPDNGEILVREGDSGTGRIKVTNGTANDVAISVVNDGDPPSEPHVMMFVQANKAATITRIGGTYRIYYKSGTDWNSERRQFSAGCTFQKFDRSFGRNESWQVNLEPTVDGNASTTEVEAY
ncbi:hypothetical protein ACIBG5_18380 [Kribbella sp. NPDC050241]|uniref:hypothetical protein n=1 Tax=Kribbella sp. NPDC050241 TaxID=3364115 RepID=UPI0037B6ECCB